MKHEHQTIMRIFQELAGYYIEHQIRDFRTHLAIEDEGAVIEIEGKIETKPSDLERFFAALQIERQHEIDDYEEILLGSHRVDEDYNLIGMSIDTAEVHYENGTLFMKVYRKNLYR